MNKVIKILMGGAAIMAAVFVGYKVIITSKMKRNRHLHKQASKNVKNALWTMRNIDKELKNPIFCDDSYWTKVGQVDLLSIYPVKSSKIAVCHKSFEFRDYGMCKRIFETYLWDGMFLVYNKTKGKFEDSRSYPLLHSLKAQITYTGEVILSRIDMCDTQKLNINQCRIPSNQFVEEIWSKKVTTFYGSNQNVNTWLNNLINVNKINGDLILALMPPRKWDSTEEIKDNWFRFLQGYEDMNKDESGRLLTLPRFVLMTVQTFKALKGNIATPNIIIKTDESIKPFEEKTWDWIKIGNDVILRKVKPVPSFDEDIQHFGIYCALWSGGNVEMDDEVHIYYPHKLV